MRLLCLHTDTVQALQRLGTSVDDLTPAGLWDTPYHLVTVSPEQRDALQRLLVTLDEVTPGALLEAGDGTWTTQAVPRASASAGGGAGAGATDAVASPS